MAVALFISPEDIKKNTILSGSVDVDKFINFIKIAQEIHIQNYLGTKLYKRIQQGITNNDLNADEVILLNDYIQDALIHFAAADYLPFAAYQVSNGGVFKHNSENSVNADKTEIDSLVQKEREFSQYYVKRLVRYLCNNNKLYPEYTQNQNEDITPSKKTAYLGNWFLDDTYIEDILKHKNLEL